MTLRLTGITWDHERGRSGVRAAGAAFAREHPGVDVSWATRSLQAFADQPAEELARRYDLIVLDHPGIGHAVARQALLPLDDALDPAFLADQAANSVGRSHESYAWQGRQWALAVDAAAQVAAFRPDLLERLGTAVPRTWDEVFALAGRAPGAVAAPLIGVDAACAFAALREGFGAEAAIATLERLLATAHPASPGWNPPALLEHMAATDEVAYCPLAFGYVNYARPRPRGRRLSFAPAPADHAGVPRGTLGGAGLAVSARARDPAAACALAAFTASGKVQRGMYFDAGGQPGHRSAWTDPRVNAAVPGFFAATLPSLDAATLRPRHDGFLTWQERAGAAICRHLARGGDRRALLGELERIDEQTRPARELAPATPTLPPASRRPYG
jgi:multiple sugar transport system substrate-binding protein